MAREMSFEKIKSILSRYSTPERRARGNAMFGRSLSLASVQNMLREILDRDLSSMDTEETKECHALARTVERKLRRRGRARLYIAALSVAVLGACLIVGIFASTGKPG